MKTRLLCLAGLGGLTALGVAGCGLIDPEITDFDLSLPEREVTVDTGDWQLTGEGELPALACADTPSVCGEGVAELCGAEEICGASCGGTTCEVTIDVALWHMFDLAQEKPELADIEGQSLVSVTIDRVGYHVPENSLNVASPRLSVYLAPPGIMSPDNPEAEEIGFIPSVGARTTVTDGELELTGDGREILAARLQSYDAPFNLILGSEVVLEAGDLVPTGRLVAVIEVSAHAGL